MGFDQIPVDGTPIQMIATKSYMVCATQQFERDLKAEQAAWAQAEAPTSRTQGHPQAEQTTLTGLEKAMASEQSAREEITAALEQNAYPDRHPARGGPRAGSRAPAASR